MTVLKRLTIQANKYKAILRHVSPCIHEWSEKIKSWKIVKIFRQFLNDVTAAEFRTGGGGGTNLEVVQKIIRFDIREASLLTLVCPGPVCLEGSKSDTMSHSVSFPRESIAYTIELLPILPIGIH